MTMTWTWRSLANAVLAVIVLGALLGQGAPALAAERGCKNNPIPDAPRWFAVAQEWSTRLVGVGPGPAPGCAP